ncbi:acylneuraminate cytidylyltransferase family protein [Campylobacter lari]|uniref:acylneuraminate cytidylyltransferase family protein n=1 Tax=Campylobacter lari TaxID=201 RepID=UPI0021F6D108|nr:acylneuraminate cytidylyltransferase family protein [Campylobacter lari]MCW0188852.1 acylneuraminate cytidylyltransferase family protein [Campylobacter lari]
MSIDKNNICIIGCREGSKGVKNKNIRNIAGKPLLAYTIEQALKSQLFRHIVLSTDSKEIADIGKKWGAEVFFLRDPAMATDNAGKLQVIQDAVIRSEKYYQEKYDIVVDLDATSPLREVEDILNAYKQFIQNDNDILITASPSRKNPYFNMVEILEKDEKTIIELSKKTSSPILRRQDAPKCYDMNASIYIWKKDILLNSQTLFTENTGLYVMPEDRSVDIDTEIDFNFVEFLLMKKLNND